MRRPLVLCIGPGWLGDAVLARPALARLGGAGTTVQVLVRRGLVRAFEALPGVATVHAVGAGRAARLRGALALRGQPWDAALILPPSFSSALAACLAGAPVRVGHAGDGRSALLTRMLPPPERASHLASQYLALVSVLLEALSDRVPRASVASGSGLDMPLLGARDEEVRAAAELLAARGSAGRPYIVLAPGARYGPAKRWPAERFAAAAALLAAATGAGIVLVGEEADAQVTAAVRAGYPAALDLAGATSLGTLVGLLAGALGVLANDSGTMHLASALGRPVVGLFGSSNPAWTRPLGPHAGVLVHPVECAPCYRANCNRDFGCMLGLEPAAVAAALVQAIAGAASQSGEGAPS